MLPYVANPQANTKRKADIDVNELENKNNNAKQNKRKTTGKEAQGYANFIKEQKN